MEKNNKLLTIILVLLIILFVSLGVYIAYDQGLIFKKDNNNQSPDIKDNSTNEDNQIKTENLDIGSGLIQSLYSLINADNSCFNTITSPEEFSIDVKNIQENTKFMMAVRIIPNDLMKTTSCNNQSAFQTFGSNIMDVSCGFNSLIADYNVKTNKFETTTGAEAITSFIPEEVLSAKYNQIFGPNTYKNLNYVEDGGQSYLYISAEKGYGIYSIPAGGTCDEHKNTLIQATKEKDNLVLEIKKEFSYTQKLGYESFEAFNYYYTFTLNQDGSYYLTNIKSVKA